MNAERIPKPYSEKEVDMEKFVRNFQEVLHWEGKKQKWAIDTEDLITNEFNVVEKSKNVSVIGFGKDFDEAYHSCLAKLEERLDRMGWDLVLIGNGVPLRNGASFQYHMSATLYELADCSAMRYV